MRMTGEGKNQVERDFGASYRNSSALPRLRMIRSGT